jgi:hypothetical protein
LKDEEPKIDGFTVGGKNWTSAIVEGPTLDLIKKRPTKKRKLTRTRKETK